MNGVNKVESYEGEWMRPGHYACPGCGVAIAMRLALKALGKKTILVIVPSCSAAIAAPFPNTSLGVSGFHTAFETAAPAAAGIAHSLDIRGKKDITVVACAGDGGTFDIGLQSLSGAADRNENLIYLCFDNEAYMNTGIQVSSATPNGAWTVTSPSGSIGRKKRFMDIIVAHRIPYAATASIGFPEDYMEKVKKARTIKGLKFIHIFTPCPTGWRMAENLTGNAAILAVESGIFQLYEVFEGKRYQLSYEPSRLPVSEYLKIQGRYRHLNEDQVLRMQTEVDEEWERLTKRTKGCL
ncbi:thiamine pyrophosphate enzyme, C-terminal TPP binding domain protein [delta proteobacterium NaphS2]|nr:thiamine pyrophosphate enzyme, C-terminal TPP binding domain protein [delta proteobacterium NaphS2]